jgi:hypothetical protein
MFFFPVEIWNRIFSYDSTYHEIFRVHVLPDIGRAYASYMGRVYKHHMRFPSPEFTQIKGIYRDAFQMTSVKEDLIVRWYESWDYIIFVVNDLRRSHSYSHAMSAERTLRPTV